MLRSAQLRCAQQAPPAPLANGCKWPAVLGPQALEGALRPPAVAANEHKPAVTVLADLARLLIRLLVQVGSFVFVVNPPCSTRG